MKHNPKRLDVLLSMYQKTTEIFSEFRKNTNIRIDPFYVEYVYDSMYLKDFIYLSTKINGKTVKYSVGFLVKHCDYWDEKSRKKCGNVTVGVMMSELKKDYYKKLFYDTSQDEIIKDILNSVEKYLKSGRRINESVIPITGFQLYAQDCYSRNNPGAGVEYGETDRYLVDEIVVDNVGLVWAE